MKRDIINEIKSIKEREEFGSRHSIIFRLSTIGNALNKFDTNANLYKQEILKYIPIATIACFESFFRSVIKEMIDFGKPYNENVIEFNQAKNFKFDFKIVNAIQSKTVTGGEFISHILPCNNFNDINSNMTIITGIDFIESLKKFEAKSIFKHTVENTKSFITNYNQIFNDVKRMFELRHIFCHEFAANIKVEEDEILRCFNNSMIFLNHTNDFIYHLLYPNAPETTAEMKLQASRDFNKTDEELSALILKIKTSMWDGHNKSRAESLIDLSIESWKKYRDDRAKSNAFMFEGGSMYSLAFTMSLTKTTKEKIDSLRNEYSLNLQKNSKH
ncbi:MAG: lysozyme inhibitor LprI family protein [Bacteroidales bacterium]|jgi:hypothetical protein